MPSCLLPTDYQIRTTNPRWKLGACHRWQSLAAATCIHYVTLYWVFSKFSLVAVWSRECVNFKNVVCVK